MSTTQYSIAHRPYTFTEYLGQDKIKNELITRSKSNNWPQTMLIRGPFGTGKTTLAQLIAMSINCINIQSNGDPCGVCESCKSIKNEEFYRDVQILNGNEIGQKDNVMEFLSDVAVLPRDDKKKIYIIEEVDALSSGAKTSLLKIIERKYAKNHVHFILLSMVDNGVPKALRSRCQEYSLAPASIKDILYICRNILVKENLWNDESIPKEFKTEVLSSIAAASGGSIRVAVQYLERAILGKYYTPDTLFENMGLVDEKKISQILLGILYKTPSIFLDLKTIDPISFYELSMYTISSAIVYSKTGFLEYDFLQQQYETLISNQHFNSLVNLFNDELFTKTRPFLRNSELITVIYNFINTLPKEELKNDAVRPANIRQLKVKG